MSLYYSDDAVTLHHGDSLDVLRGLDADAVDCCVTSPPYFGLRDYGQAGQYGLEASPSEYVETMRAVFHELRRVLADDGTLWLNIGDSYVSGGAIGRNDVGRDFTLPAKNLLGIPWRVAFALQDDGWILRNAIVWHKPNAMPESVTDRLSGRYETVFVFSKSRRYWFDLDLIREAYDGDRAVTRRVRTGVTNKENSIATPWRPRAVYGAAAGTNLTVTGERHTAEHEHGRNPGDVWTIPTQPFPGAHFATMPVSLAGRCIQAGCKPAGTVLDTAYLLDWTLS